MSNLPAVANRLKASGFSYMLQEKAFAKYHNKLLKTGHLAQLLLQVQKMGPKHLITKRKIILKLNF